MKTKLILAGLLVLGFAMPTAVAHHAGDESEAGGTVLAGTTYYVYTGGDTPTVWTEENGHDGLQTTETTYEASAGTCEVDSDTFDDQGDTDPANDVCIVSPDDQFEPL